ncbi:hypothetical protein D3C85_1370930 [compost metagenome]
MLVPKVETKTYFYWTDVADAIAKEWNCKTEDFHHTFCEWMDEHDPEAGSDMIGSKHNIDEQIAELEKTIQKDVEESGEYDGLEGEELEEAINDNYYGLAFLKTLKKVLGVHSTDAAFLYSW